MARLRRMTVSDGFKSFVLDQLDGLGELTARPMFGGVGLYCDGVFIGILAADVLYLKVGDANRNDYVAAGMQAFRPYPDRPGTMKYYEVPIGVLESREDLLAWARKALRVATGR